MRTRFLIPALSALALTIAAVFTMARGAEVTLGGLTITSVWARATPPGASTGAVYVTVENHGSSEDKLVSAASPVAQSAMLHESIVENGVSSMRMVEGNIPAGAALEMKPGGIHIMLMGLKAPLKLGDTIDVTLDFEKAGHLATKARVGPVGAGGPME